MFKAGDKVVCIAESFGGTLTAGKEYVVLRACGRELVLENDNRMDGPQAWFASRFELSKSNYHPHHDLIIQWAKGAKIERYYDSHFRAGVVEEWLEEATPMWYKYVQYRVKPEPSEKDKQISDIQLQMKELSDKLEKLKSKED